MIEAVRKYIEFMNVPPNATGEIKLTPDELKRQKSKATSWAFMPLQRKLVFYNKFRNIEELNVYQIVFLQSSPQLITIKMSAWSK